MSLSTSPISVRDMIDLVNSHQFFIATVRNGNKEYINWLVPLLWGVPECVKTQIYSDEDLAFFAEFAKNYWMSIVPVVVKCKSKSDRLDADFASWKTEMHTKCDEIDRLLKQEEDAKFMREMTPYTCGGCNAKYGPAKDRGLCHKCD